MGTRVYVGNLYHNTRERDLEKFFDGYGRICDVFLKNGYGFVEFANQRDADDAVYDLNGKQLLGERVVVELARGRRRDRFGGPGGGGGGRGERRPAWLDKYGPPERTENRLIVENLSSRVSWQDLKDFFRRAGDITYADAHKPRMNEGIVEFASYNDMKYALEKYDDVELKGRRIMLSEDKPRSSRRKERRSRSRSRRRRSSSSKSRSRSVSHSRKRHHSSSGSRSPVPKKRSRSKSRSPVQRKQSLSRSRSRSSEARNKSYSRSRSRSPSIPADKSTKKHASRSRSRTRSKSKSIERDNKHYSQSRSKSRESYKSGGRRSESR